VALQIEVDIDRIDRAICGRQDQKAPCGRRENMPKIGVELPEDLVDAIKLPLEEVPMRLRKELAVRLYEKRLLGFGKARQLAEMSKWEFQRLLGEERILRSYDSEELEKDIESLQELESE